MYLIQGACGRIWIQDLLVHSRNVLVCDRFEQKDKATSAGWSRAKRCEVAIPHYTSGCVTQQDL